VYFSVFSLSSALLLWESVVTLALTGNITFGQASRHQRVPVFQGHRLPLTGSRWGIRWLISRRTNQTFCIFPYLGWRLWKSVVTLEMKRNTIQDRVFRRQRILVFQWQRLPLTGSRCAIRRLIGRQTKPTLWFLFHVFPVTCMAVFTKCCDACGDKYCHFR
jgi:hypothetical protein